MPLKVRNGSRVVTVSLWFVFLISLVKLDKVILLSNTMQSKYLSHIHYVVFFLLRFVFTVIVHVRL